MKPEPVFLIVGAPAVGKSTVSRALAGRFARSIHIPVDDLRDMVVGGLVLPRPDWGPALVEQVRLARRSAIASAVRYAEAGFAVVIDDFWDPPGLLEYRGLPGSHPLHRVLLRPAREVALERNRGRHGDDPVRAYLDEGIHLVYDALERPAAVAQLEDEDWFVIDNAELDPAAAAARILERAGVSPAGPPD